MAIANPPAFGVTLPAFRQSQETIDLMRSRRSTPADCLGDPGPDNAQLEVMLEIAARAPDHRRVVPFRFIIFEGEARARFGDILRNRFVDIEPDAEARRISCEQNRFMRAPVVVAIVSRVDKAHRTPEWEQILTAGAVCQNLLIAASASGFAAQWITEWYAVDNVVLAALGLDAHERIAGFIYIGAAKEPPKERVRPDMAAITMRY